MSENPKKFKSKYPLKLSDEKRAFVVIALTDKFSPAGKLAAAIALAHYDSRVGYAYASVPTMTREAGYKPSSTKTLNRGLTEIHDKGAFKVVRRTGAANTHHICPIMSWFRAEYEHLLKSGRVEEDEFADIRDGENNSGSQPELKSGSEQEKAGSEPNNSGSQPNNSGSEPKNAGSGPDEEGSVKKASEEDQEKRIKPRGAPASGERGPDVGSVDDDRPRTKPANDNEIKPWPEDIVSRFMKLYPKGGDLKKVAEALEEIRREGRTEYSDVLRGVRNYAMEKADTPPDFIKAPENFLKDRLWEGYRQDRRPKSQMAI